MTIGPVFLLGLLGITFYLGSRPSKLPSRRGVSPRIRIRNRNINRDAVGVSSSGATVLGSTDAGSKIPEQDASTNTITNIDGNIATNSGMTSILPVDTSVLDKDDGDHAPSSRERTLTRGRSVRRIWKDGPGDNANSEQVGTIKAGFERERSWGDKIVIVIELGARRITFPSFPTFLLYFL